MKVFKNLCLLLASSLLLFECGEKKEKGEFETFELKDGIIKEIHQEITKEEFEEIPLSDIAEDKILSPEVSKKEFALYEVIPDQGINKGGETVLIKGSGFEEGVKVFFGQSEVISVFILSDESINVVTPPGVPGLVDVRAIHPDGRSSVLKDGFTYISSVMVKEIEPKTSPVIGGIPVSVKGEGFTGNVKVLVGGKEAMSITVVSNNEIMFITPPNSTGFKNLSITSEMGFTTVKDAIYYFEYPEIKKVEPPCGPVEGLTDVIIKGKGFEKGTKVYFGDKEGGDLGITSPHELKIKTPTGKKGFVDISVATPYGQATLQDGFYYYEKEESLKEVKIKAVIPSEGSENGGEEVFILASGLGNKDSTSIFFGNKKATINYIEPSFMTAKVITPPQNVGMVDVKLKTPEGEDIKKNGFKYNKALQITGVTPNKGPKEGGTYITIHGKGFTPISQVKVGGLPAKNIEVKDESLITAITPPGAPGPANIEVITEHGSTILEGGFEYTTKAVLYLVYPEMGATSGGTLVHIYGAGFGKTAEVYFGGNPASNIEIVSSTMIRAKTPPNDVGAVDVIVVTGGEKLFIENGFIYYDPLSYFGGTWGGEIVGTVNVTVLDGSNGGPLADAYVILWTDPKTPYQGWTDLEGKITFSGEDLQGWQMVSVSKECYENVSVVKFNAKNITVYMLYVCPSPGFPPMVPPGQVSGKVINLDKYIVSPPGNCYVKGVGADGILCKPCSKDAECGGSKNSCIKIGDWGNFCSIPCKSPADCPQGYMCVNVTGKGAMCLPQAGKKLAMCEYSMPDIFSALSQPPTPVETDSSGGFFMQTRLGEIAIICLGGVKDYDTGIFTPYAMGVKRHVFVGPGMKVENLFIKLSIPLTREIRIRLDDPPTGVPGPNFNYLFTFIDLGSDGVYKSKEEVAGFGNEEIYVKNQPLGFKGDIYDASFIFLGGAFSSTADNTPFSVTLHQGIKEVQDDILYKGNKEDSFEPEHSGVKNDIYGIFGTSPQNMFAVGNKGSIYFYNGNFFTKQVIEIDENITLRGIWGAGDNDIWVVGGGGTILHFDGTKWEKVNSSTFAQLSAICGNKKDNIYAVGSYEMLHYDGTQWKKVLNVPLKSFNDLYVFPDGEVYAVGQYGSIVKGSSEGFITDVSGTSMELFGIMGTSKDNIYAVGAHGTVLYYNGNFWIGIKGPNERNLRDVLVFSNDDIYVVGDRGGIFHYDGKEWKDLSVKDYYTQLQVIFGFKEENKIFSMGMGQLLLGPLLQVPQVLYPPDNGIMKDRIIQFKTKEGPPSHFNYINIAIPSFFGDISVWSIITKGDVELVELPEFENIEGLPDIPPATTLKLTILRTYREGFDINNFDYTDLNTLMWQSWAVEITTFTK